MKGQHDEKNINYRRNDFCQQIRGWLKEVAVWYLENEAEVNKKPYFDYLDANLAWSLYEKF